MPRIIRLTEKRKKLRRPIRMTPRICKLLWKSRPRALGVGLAIRVSERAHLEVMTVMLSTAIQRSQAKLKMKIAARATILSAKTMTRLQRRWLTATHMEFLNPLLSRQRRNTRKVVSLY